MASKQNQAPMSFECMAYLDLFHSGSLEAQVERVVTETAHLEVVPVVTHADDGHLSVLDQLNQFLKRKTQCPRSERRQRNIFSVSIFTCRFLFLGQPSYKPSTQSQSRPTFASFFGRKRICRQ